MQTRKKFVAGNWKMYTTAASARELARAVAGGVAAGAGVDVLVCPPFPYLGVVGAAGPVEVAVADHHAYLDAVGPNFVRELRPQVFIIPAWYVSHPAALPLRRMFSRKLYSGDRDVFATCTMEENRVFNNQFNSMMKSMDGHVVVRVAPGGETFRVVVTDNSDNSDRVKLVSGPHRCN